jgi:hypothetical protein
MITRERTYRGFLISCFDLAQLGDSETRGKTYSVFQNESAFQSGAEPLSSRECLRTLREARAFVDGLQGATP